MNHNDAVELLQNRLLFGDSIAANVQPGLDEDGNRITPVVDREMHAAIEALKQMQPARELLAAFVRRLSWHAMPGQTVDAHLRAAAETIALEPTTGYRHQLATSLTDCAINLAADKLERPKP